MATLNDLDSLSEMVFMLWPEGYTILSLQQEIFQILVNDKAVIFLAKNNYIDVGFALCQIRYDNVEGTVITPIGYMEGIFVKEELRALGKGKKLIRACEDWLRDKNITEIASDTEILNSANIQFNLNQGFIEVNRIICFSKRI